MFDTRYDNGGIWPHMPRVGDVPEGYEWGWNPLTYRYEWVTKPLTTVSTTTTISPMAKQVIEYTESMDTSDTSTSIAHVWYNADTERMTLRFHHGGLYSYDDVDADLFDDFMNAESLGKFFAKTFRKDARYRSEDWPGEKHDEANVRFVKVAAKKRPEPVVAEVTTAKELSFVIHYDQTVRRSHTYAIKATTMDEAIAKFKAYRGKDDDIEVTGVFIPVGE